MKSISAIIVNWNGFEDTAECIRSLLKQTHPEVEIIVVDNGSTDGSLVSLRRDFSGVRIIANETNMGFGPAVNRGLEIASGDHLIFLNNDLVLEPSCLAELSRQLESDDNIGGVVPKILYFDPPDTINSFGVEVHYTGMACPHLIGVKDTPHLRIYETACGGIFMFSRSVYEATGGFDTDLFLYHEDHDLSWRIRLLGKKLMVCPSAVMKHHYKFNKGVFKFYSSEKNRLYLLLKLYECKTLALLLPALALVELAQWGHALTNGWFALKLKSYFEILGLLPRILEKRKKVQAERTLSDRAITGLHEGTLRLSGIKSPLLEDVLKPLLEKYWEKVREKI